MGSTVDLSQSFDQAHPGTLYWTVSLYIPADKLSAAIGLAKAGGDASRVEPDTWRKLAMTDCCSLVLGGAMDPLFNDIADRDVQGTAQEFLIAAMDSPGNDADAMQSARERILDEIEVTFTPPASVGWMTEGRQYEASPAGLSEPREMSLKRFWFAHYGGALSYHLSFSYRYKPLPAERARRAGPLGDGYVPANYYFLSMLQKLVAPKELTLPVEKLMAAGHRGEARVCSVFAPDTGIALLDHRIVTGLAPPTAEGASDEPTTFWGGLAARFNDDAQRLVERLAKVLPGGCEIMPAQADWRQALLDDQPVIEVPGLGMPRCRFMFFFHDDRFFNRLMPTGPQGSSIDRKVMVKDDCYQPYLDEVARLRRNTPVDPVALDEAYWQWVGSRADDYARWCTDGTIRPNDDSIAFSNPAEWAEAIRKGNCCLTVAPDGSPLDPPLPLHVPAYEAGRTDCLDYLFLSGFNQNIIDFMNQDTSEILDSTDPLYPGGEDQADERFFVRFANHRALITYVPSSRSLEIGNDYIGTCPYAFLIHVLAMHNEYLDRLHETATADRIRRIEDLLNAGRSSATGGSGRLESKALDGLETMINTAKLSNYRDYLRYRYINPFRYDTERDVFEKLERLRGTSRKQQALQEALGSLEDHAYDLARQSRRAEQEREQRYEKKVTMGFAVVGLAGIIQMIYGLILPRLDKSYLYPNRIGEVAANATKAASPDRYLVTAESLIALVALLFTIAVLLVLPRLLLRKWSHAVALFVFIIGVLSAGYYYLLR